MDNLGYLTVPGKDFKILLPIDFVPNGDRYLAIKLNIDTVTPSGIILPETIKDETKPAILMILAKGPGLDDDRMIYDPGSIVLASRYGGVELELPISRVKPDSNESILVQEKLVIIKQLEIMGFISSTNNSILSIR